MALRTKVRRSSARRGSPSLGSRSTRPRTTRADRPAASRKAHPFRATKAPSTGINTYAKALRFLSSLNDFERLRIVRYNTTNFDLDRMRTLLKKLGNPQDSFRSVHIAGTKGKGSTCAMIASMLHASGYKTALYSSPHLVDVRERMCINGDTVSYADFVRLVRLIEPVVKRMKPTPTYFDVLTAIAVGC